MANRFLFIHQNFPGQYRHLARALIKQGHRCVAIAAQRAPGLDEVKVKQAVIDGTAELSGLHPWAYDMQVKCLRAEAVAREAFALSRQGFIPDLIVGHPGWGELLAIKDIFPGVPVLHQLEFFYQVSGADVGFDPEFAGQIDPSEAWCSATRLRLRRVPQMLAFHDLDHAIAPTHWQASTAPRIFSDRISVIHEGIDTERIHPNPKAVVRLKKAGLTFHPGDELVTFVARNLEPYRGFHVFMRMLPLLQALRPNCHVVIVGADGVSYGAPPTVGGSWREVLLAELADKVDLSRIHFVGRLPHPVLHNLFQVSACHVYLTYPFVLSWSLMEAMSCGAVVVGSDTEPVREVIKDGKNGFLIDFFDINALAKKIAKVLELQMQLLVLRDAARRTIQLNYDLKSVCLPRQLQLIDQLVHKRIIS